MAMGGNGFFSCSQYDLNILRNTLPGRLNSYEGSKENYLRELSLFKKPGLYSSAQGSPAGVARGLTEFCFNAQ
jgi:hypothetical protein